MPLLDRVLKLRAQKAAAPDASPRPPRRRLRKILIGVAVAFVALIAFGFFAAPPILHSLLTSRLSEELGRKVTVGDIRINPFALTLEIHDFVIHEPGSTQRFVAFQRLKVDVDAESIYRRAPVLSEVTLEKPYVNVVLLARNRLNFTDLIEKFSKDKKPDEQPARFSVNNIRILGGEVDVDDRPRKTKHQVRELALAVPFVSNLPYHGNIFVQPAFGASVNGTRFDVKGKSKPFSEARETDLELSLKDLDLPYYLRYLPMTLPYRIASARLDLDATIGFAQPAGKPSRLTVTASTALRAVRVIASTDAPLVSFERLDVRTKPIDVFGDVIAVASVKLAGADVNAIRQADGVLNLAILGATGASTSQEEQPPEPKPAGDAKPKTITVDKIELSAARIRFQDDMVQPAFQTVIAPLDVVVEGISTAAGAQPAHLLLTATTDAQESLRIEGTASVAGKSASIDASLSQVPIPRYAAYYRNAIAFDIGSGTLSLSAHADVAAPPEGLSLLLSKGTLDLAALRLRKAGEPADFLSLAQFSVKDTSLDLAQQRVTVGDILADKLDVRARRAKNGVVNLATLTPSKPAEAKPAPAPDAAPAKPWVITLAHVLVDRSLIEFQDAVPATPVTLSLSPTRVEVSDLVLGAPGTARLALKTLLNGKGSFDASGTFAIDPVALDLKTRIANLDIPTFQPYFADRLNVTLAGARVGADGRLGVRLPAGKPALISYEGDAGISKFASTDNRTGEDLLQWESLYFKGVRAKSEPFALAIREVSLTDFRSRLQVNADGTLNVQGLVAQDPNAAPAESPDAPAKPGNPSETKAADASPVPRSITIDQVTLQGGTVLFSDKLVKPNVSATLTEIGGRVTGLLADPSTKADVDLRGRLSNQAPLEITGKVNPLSGDLYADLKVSFRDIELPPFTPYSGKYAGYTIEKGKLTLDLRYLIEKRKITAENKVFIDQFTFGEKVESADAVNLPVQLAVSLLKDRDGRINLDVPVSGSLDDPKFKLGRVIWQIIVNLFTKAVTAPFALLGSLMGGSGEELSYLEFAQGSSTPDDAGNAKLAQLAKALTDRPALGLEVTGRVDPETDREALRQIAFENKLRAQKFAALSREGQAPASVEATVYTPDEVEGLLRKAYKQEKFPKPRNAIGLEKSLPASEMEKLILTSIVVGPDDLRQLGLQRAQSIKDTLVTRHGIASERVFLVEARTEPGGSGKDKGRPSRADFVIR